MTDTKAGRPAIGTPVSVTLPDPVLDEVKKFAEEDGVTRSEELRLIITQGLASRRSAATAAPPDSASTRRLHKELRPATDLVASWIAADPEETRARFVRYRRATSDAKLLVQFLLDATRELADTGALADGKKLGGSLFAKLSDSDDWRLRGQLFFEVVAEMGNRGVVIPPGKPGDPG